MTAIRDPQAERAVARAFVARVLRRMLADLRLEWERFAGLVVERGAARAIAARVVELLRSERRALAGLGANDLWAADYVTRHAVEMLAEVAEALELVEPFDRQRTVEEALPAVLDAAFQLTKLRQPFRRRLVMLRVEQHLRERVQTDAAAVNYH